jgi:hypothetical protein
LKALYHHKKNALSRKAATHLVDLTDSASNFSDYGTVRADRTIARTGVAKYRAVVFYKDDMGAMGANPVITAWQITRFSFVIDWFCDVSSWLQAISPREGYTELGISVSSVLDYSEMDTQYYSAGSSGNMSVSVQPRMVQTTVRKYERLAYTGFPLPTVQVRLNPYKILDLAALAIQARSDVFKILRL